MKLFASLLFLLFEALASKAAKLPNPVQLETWVSKGQLDDTISVKFQAQNENALHGYIQRTMTRTGCHNPRRLFQQAPEPLEAQHRAAGLHLWYIFDCTDVASQYRYSTNENKVQAMSLNVNKGRGAQKAFGKLLVSPDRVTNGANSDLGIDIVEPGFRVVSKVYGPAEEVPVQSFLRHNSGRYLMSGSNDPYASAYQSHYDTINLPAAWDIMNQENAWPQAQGVIVQVIDAGWDMSHVDLGSNKWLNPGEVCGDGIDNDGNGFVDDCHGYNHADGTGTDLLGSSEHGSHCSGTISANTDNGLGVAGIAGGLDGYAGASIMASVVFGKTGNPFQGVVNAISYGGDHGAHVSSNSWGFDCENCFSQSVADAIDYATDRGVVVVFAAGNDNSTTVGNFPASYSKVISVAATDDSKVAAGFTNYGDWVDIAAPGVRVVSTGYANRYLYMSGTSMACPHVAGVMALGKALDPQASPDKLKNCLLTTAEDIDALQQVGSNKIGKLGAGMVNAAAFLECMRPPPPVNVPPVADFQHSCTDLECTFTDLSTDSDGTVTSSSWTLGDGSSSTQLNLVHTYSAAGTYTVSLTVTDSDGAMDSVSQSVTVTSPTTAPPPSLTPAPLATLETMVVNNVGGATWTTVPLSKTFIDPIPVCSVDYAGSSVPVVVRMQGVVQNTNSFQIRLQNPGNKASVPLKAVNCLVVEKGKWQMPDGRMLEAMSYTSTVTDNKNSWTGQPQSYGNSYTNPVVVGQVMTSNDPGWSVFWSSAGAGSRTAPPSGTSFAAGKHVGEDTDRGRADETIAIVVMEAGHGTSPSYEAGLGGDIVRGYDDNGSGYSYTYYSTAFSAAPRVRIVSQAGMDGSDGGWAVLTGAQTASKLRMVIDEDQISGNERRHTTEQVAYVVFEEEGSIYLSAITNDSLTTTTTAPLTNPECTPCQQDSDCLDPTNKRGLNEACGNLSCVSGTCQFVAWNDVGDCVDSNFLTCSGDDTKCTKGPSVLNYKGKCIGYANNECVYQWCPGAPS